MSNHARPAVQPRTHRTRKKLMTALDTLLRHHEFEQIAVSDIAAEAKVAVGTVYSHFKDKDAFLAELLHQRKKTIQARLDAVDAGDMESRLQSAGGLRPALELAARSAFEQIRDDAHIIRAVHTHARLNPDLVDTEWEEITNRAFLGSQALVNAFSDEIRRTDKAAAARMLNYFFTVIFLRIALLPHHGMMTVHAPTDEDLVGEAADMAYAYLTLPD